MSFDSAPQNCDSPADLLRRPSAGGTVSPSTLRRQSLSRPAADWPCRRVLMSTAPLSEKRFSFRSYPTIGKRKLSIPFGDFCIKHKRRAGKMHKNSADWPDVKKGHPPGCPFLEAPPGIGPGNRGFAVRCLTAWLWRHLYKTEAGAVRRTRDCCFYGAGNEARTRYLHLGKVALYRMSYARMDPPRCGGWCLRSELNQRHADFQSAALPTELQRHIQS